MTLQERILSALAAGTCRASAIHAMLATTPVSTVDLVLRGLVNDGRVRFRLGHYELVPDAAEAQALVYVSRAVPILEPAPNEAAKMNIRGPTFHPRLLRRLLVQADASREYIRVLERDLARERQHLADTEELIRIGTVGGAA